VVLTISISLHQAARYPRVWSRDVSLKAWKLCLAGEKSDEVSPYAAPIRAKDLSGLPPAYMCIGERI
jgi:acetyl esterase/lipase